MRGNVRAYSRLVEGINIAVAAIEHAIQLENVAVSFCATEFVARPLIESVRETELECITNVEAENEDVLLLGQRPGGIGSA